MTSAAVWVANLLDQTVSRLDPVTGRVTATLGVGDGPSTIARAGTGLWVSDQFDGTVDFIDLRATRVARTIRLSGSPQGMVATPAGLWLATGAFATARHRGGTVTAVNYDLPATDPDQEYAPFTNAVPAAVYDGLVAFRRAGGAAGETLVPDLARTLPRPADGGRTYVFTLRPGIHYSNGVLVRASDFRRGLERQITTGANPGYYDEIVGSPVCRQHPSRCDLTRGIVTDDALGTVAFHLTQADPDLLYELALNLAVPAPPGSPLHSVITGPPFLPGTGPYLISGYRPNVSFTLTRNPYFHQWSYAAQPAGYPSVIRFRQETSLGKQQSEVLAGQADLAALDRNDEALAARYPARVHTALKLWIIYLFLNTRQPPFSSLPARQAVNYAIDRAKLLQLFRYAPGQAAVTCQILPAGFPEHQDYCPYTTDPGDGAWHGPDLARARQLVAASGTANTPVTLWTIDGVAGPGVESYLVSLLNQLGYHARLRTVSAVQYFQTVTDTRRKIQAGLQGWGADFPAASTFYIPTLSCHSLSRDPANTTNYGGFCDPRAEQLAAQAEAAQLTDPGAARTYWESFDRAVTMQAPWVPILNQAPAVFVSARVGNYQDSPVYGPLLDQIWVR